ncbi:ExeM/NucH family extracellular endonuclease [Georgenia sp. Z1344]|uniref:ExeM/NucH family extracellular endonuclease n=1 Tax=Georgenia sp. Z1344 TaxID=3416706 RepID=UPI003CFB46D2
MTDRPTTGRRGVGLGAVVALGLTSVVVPVAALPAAAAPDDSAVVITEYYARGGSANAPYQQKFVELYNPTDEPIDLSGMSLQYRSATGSGATNNNVALEGTIEPGEHFVVSGASNGGNGEDISALADQDAGGSFNPGGTNGVVVLVDGTDNVTLPQGTVATGDLDGAIVDLVGTGTATTFETAAAASEGNNSTPLSWQRDGFADSDDNSTDFTMAAPTPEIEGGGDPDPDPDPEPGEPVTIEEIQGEGDATPLAGQSVTTRGVVTAVYPTGGFNGFTIQTEGTGGDLTEHTASSGIFVYGPDVVGDVEIGDFVEVSGEAGEYFGLTQISGPTVTPLEEEFAAVEPVEAAWPETDAERELYESMLMLPTDEFTVSNTYWTLQYGEVGLATGDSPLVTPTDVANPVTDPEGVAAAEADNAARGVVLNDGSSFNLINFNFEDHEIPLPYVTPEAPLRTGASATISSPVVVDFRRVQNGDSAWSFQPTTRATGENYTEWVSFENDRAEHAAPAEVGGNIQVASFNVLNYFSTLGEDEEGCEFYPDREGNPTTADWCDVRGAWSSEAFARQEEKIVEAINTLDADVVALEEIENSAEFGQDRDAALATLTEALNEDAGAGTWGYVESPAELPADEDVIRTAFIYRIDTISPVGDSVILTDSPAFGNAREPLAQEFAAVGADEELSETTFVVTANHFKSKGSGTDDGTGQGNANPDRIAQAEALVEFTEENWGAEQPVLHAGDFNAYTAEDPMQILYGAGYTNLTEFERSGAHSYNFDGMDGSLDHILANEAALELFTGSAIWEINANEPLALEYSRHNYNVTNFHEVSPFRSSDHNPGIVGLDIPVSGGEEPEEPVVVTPEDVVFTDADGTDADTFTVPAVEGVEYLVGDEVVEAGTHPGEGTVTVTARAADGYELAEDATTEWSHTFDDSTTPDPDPEPVPPTPGRGFYLNDGWDIWADHEFSFGRPGDQVLVGDWDGNGSDTLAVRRGNAYFLSNSLYGGNADIELTFGRSGDTVLVGDWDGDGVDSFAVRRGNSYFLTNRHTGGDAETELDYGRAGDQVLVGDYDGNGTDTFAVRRGARYFVSNSLASGWADAEFTYGRGNDQVLVGDWDGDGSDTFASRRGNLYLMSNTLTGGWADREVHYGRSGDEVFVGDWNGDGSDTLGIRR